MDNNKIFLIFILVQFVHPYQLAKEYPDQIKSCNLGEELKNECNKCICTVSGYYNCTAQSCNTTNVKVTSINANKTVTHNTNTSGTATQFHKQRECHANTIYMLNTTVCICSKGGKWPHQNCKNIFKSLPNATPSKPCEPNSFVIVDCNVCRCGSNGTILQDRCTKNTCDKKNGNSNARRLNHLTKVYGRCEAKNWYSLAPCQFCFCVHENKLVCNKGSNYADKVQLGTYSLSVCGKNFVAEALQLVPENVNKKWLKQLEVVTPKIITTTATTKKPRVVVEMNRQKPNSDEFDAPNLKKYLRHNDDEEQRGFTYMPFDEQNIETNAKDNEKYEPEEDSYSSSETDTGVEIEVPRTLKPGSLTQNVENLIRSAPDDFKSSSTFKKITESLKINFPSVLDRVLKMAIRKSMLTLNN